MEAVNEDLPKFPLDALSMRARNNTHPRDPENVSWAFEPATEEKSDVDSNEQEE